MKTLRIEHGYKTIDGKLAAQFPAPAHVLRTVREDTKVVTADGTTVALLLRGVIPSELHQLAFRLLKTVNGLVSNRATAVGTRSLPRSIGLNGEPSKRSGVNAAVLKVIDARQGILGYSGRPLHRTRLTVDHPEMLQGNKQLIEFVDSIYRKHLPDFYAGQLREVMKAPSYRLWKTCFTTMYVAKNFRTAYHPDTGNLPGTLTALMPMGKFTGGELVLPRWRLAISFKPGDLLFFDSQQLHGNLPFDGERVSAAFYCAKSIRDRADHKEPA